MALYTEKLNIKLIQKTDKFVNEAINACIEDADNKLVGISHIDEPSHWELWKANTTYELNDVVRISLLKSNQYMQCTTSGTSGATSPTSITVGSPITDGTVTWVVKELGVMGQHNDLSGRNLPNAHSIASITDLQTTLDTKLNKYDYTEAGIIDFPSIVDNGNGTISLSGGNYNLYADGNGTTPLTKYAGVAQTITLVDGANNYVCAHLNNNVLEYMLADRANIDYRSVVPIYTVFRTGTLLEPVSWGTYAKGLASLLLKWKNRTSRFSRESGLMLGESTGRIITLTSGVVWFSVSELAMQAVNSSTDDVYQCINTNGIWTYNKVTQYNNTQYNNVSTGLATLDNNKYNVTWVYRDIKTDVKKLYLVLGTSSYALSDAQASFIPTIPAMLDTQCMLVGRIICKKDATFATSIESSFTMGFSGGGGSTNASDITINDVGGYFTGADVESALQELGARNIFTNDEKAVVDHITVTANTDLDTLRTDSHTHTNKTDLDKIGEDTNGNLTYSGKTVVGGIVAWTPSTAYIAGQLVYNENITYRVTNNFTSGTTFSDTNLKEVVIGYLKDWAPSTLYSIDQCVYNSKSILRNKVSHTSGSSYDTNEASNWEVIATSGAVVNAWSANTLYTANEMVIYNDTIYFANVTHTSSSTFEADMIVGSEKWRTANTSSCLGDWKQVTRLDATAGTIVTITINNTYTFVTPPIEVLKFVAGTTNVTVNEFTFDAGDGSKFNYNSSYINFTGTVQQISTYSINMTSPIAINDGTSYGYISESSDIDFSMYKSVEGISIT